jgi:torulene dioxygenase
MAATTSAQQTGAAALFTSVHETPDTVELPVTGVLPAYLHGALYRNGPGVFETLHADGQATERRHWFDGVTMLHKFDIIGQDNAVMYKSRILAPGLLRAALSVPKANYVGSNAFGVTDPCKSMFAKLFAMFSPFGAATKDPQTGEIASNVGVTVENVAGLGIMSRSDFSTMCKFDLDSLEVKEFLEWSAVDVVEGTSKKDLTGVMSAAHGQYDADTKEYYNFVYDFGPDPGMYKILCIGTAGKAEVIAQFRDRCSYVHSMALTEKYLIFILCPARINAIRLLYEKSVAGAMRFDTNAETKFYVISRREKRVIAVYAAEPFWMFHTINAFEDPASGDVHVDLCRYENADCIDQFYVETLKSKPASYFSAASANRYSLRNIPQAVTATVAKSGSKNVVNLRAERRELSTVPLELPRINESFSKKQYRFAYGPGQGIGTHSASTHGIAFMKEVIKVDVTDPSNVKAWSAENTFVGEAIFIVDPQGRAEDDGVLCFVAYNSDRSRSALVVVDARTMKEVARAECPSVVPAGFHGSYLPRI